MDKLLITEALAGYLSDGMVRFLEPASLAQTSKERISSTFAGKHCPGQDDDFSPRMRTLQALPQPPFR